MRSNKALKWKPVDRKSVAKTEFEQDTCCKILVAYEDSLCRDHALGTIDYLEKTLGGEVSFTFSWWKMSHLLDPIIESEAIRAAISADVIVLSMHSTSMIDTATSDWIEAWLPQKRHSDSLLVALVGTKDDKRTGFTPTHVQLKNAAERGRMDFLPLVMQSVEKRGAHTTEKLLSRVVQTSPLLEEILRRPLPPPRWGINE